MLYRWTVMAFRLFFFLSLPQLCPFCFTAILFFCDNCIDLRAAVPSFPLPILSFRYCFLLLSWIALFPHGF